MPLISVIVPIYKVEPYLERCIESVLHQTFRDFELILIDDGSPDFCGEICDRYALEYPQITVIHHENRGLSGARNAGIDWCMAHSDSQWITFIDSDDWVFAQYLEYLYRAVSENEVDVGLCQTFFAKNQTDCDNIAADAYTSFSVSPEDYWIKKNGDVSVAWGKLYRKRLFQTLRFPLGKIYEDEYTTYQALFSCKKIAVTNAVLYVYFFSQSSILRSAWNRSKLDNIQALIFQMQYFKKSGFRRAFRLTRKKSDSILLYDWNMTRVHSQQFGSYRGIIERLLQEGWQTVSTCPIWKYRKSGTLYWLLSVLRGRCRLLKYAVVNQLRKVMKLDR